MTGDLGTAVTSPHPAIALFAAAPGRDEITVEWRVDGLDGPLPDVDVFVGRTRATLFDESPLSVDASQLRVTADGLDENAEYFLGLEVEDEGEMRRSGPVLRVVTGAPVYCDAGSTAGAPDGSSPETAFPNLQVAVIQTFLAGGGNIWIAAGVYPDLAINLPAGVHLYGGFPPGFAGPRDATAWTTRLTGRSGAGVLNMVPGDAPGILDGLSIDGLGDATNAVQSADAEFEARDLVLARCGRGARLRGPEDETLRVKFVACEFVENTGEGLSIEGAFDLLVEACEFTANGQEGLDAGKLIAPDGDRAGVTLVDSRFARNGAQGVDVDLDAPELGGAVGGLFEIDVLDCAFEANVESGFLIDLDFEQHPLWRAEVTIRGCESRANGLHGGSLDLDAAATVLVHRFASTANRGSGLRVTSESRRGTVTVSSSALVGNAGRGAWFSNGNFGAVLSHCVVAGNAGGGLVGEIVESVAHSCVFYLQPAPLSGFFGWRNSLTTDALEMPFEHAPVRYSIASGFQGDELRVPSPQEIAAGEVSEVLDDRIARQVTGVSAVGVSLDPSVSDLAPPIAVAFFSAGSADVLEDYRLATGSPAAGAGMAEPFGSPVDAGIFGAPWTGPPGVEELVPRAPFLVADRTPGWPDPLPADADFEVSFSGGVPDGVTLAAGVYAVDAAGNDLPVDHEVVGDRVRVHPPAGGWANGTVLQFHSGVRSLAGDPLSVPVAFRLEVAGG